MPKRKKTAPQYPRTWVVTHTFHWNGRHIKPGTELSIQGERGRFRFVKLVQVCSESGSEIAREWIDVVGGKNNLDRSFHPSRIKTVHRLKKTRENAA